MKFWAQQQPWPLGPQWWSPAKHRASHPHCCKGDASCSAGWNLNMCLRFLMRSQYPACGVLKPWPLLHQVKNNVLLVVNFHISQLLSVLRSSQTGLPVNYFYTKISCSSLYKNKWTSDIKLKGKQRCWVLNILRAGEKSVNRFINVFFSAKILENACNSLQLTGCWFCRKKRFLSPLTPSHSCSLFWLFKN